MKKLIILLIVLTATGCSAHRRAIIAQNLKDPAFWDRSLDTVNKMQPQPAAQPQVKYCRKVGESQVITVKWGDMCPFGWY